jgi:hypothetical protein
MYAFERRSPCVYVLLKVKRAIAYEQSRENQHIHQVLDIFIFQFYRHRKKARMLASAVHTDKLHFAQRPGPHMSVRLKYRKDTLTARPNLSTDY